MVPLVPRQPRDSHLISPSDREAGSVRMSRISNEKLRHWWHATGEWQWRFWDVRGGQWCSWI